MKRTICIMMVVLIILATICGCDSQKKTGNIVTDLNGNNVTIPDKITGTSSNAASVTTHIVMIAGADAVTIAPASFESGHTKEFENLFAGTSDIKLSNGNKISAETLLDSGVNVFFTTKQAEADEYSKAGIACVVLNYDTIETIAQTFVVIGKVFGGEAETKAKKIGDSILDCKSNVENLISQTPESERTSVYYVSASTQTTPYLTQGKGTSTETLLNMCGASLVTPGSGLDVTVNPEFLLEQDPDYILIDGYLAKEAHEELLKDPVLKELTAIKNNNIIIAPVGYFRPILRPGAESGLGLIFLAQKFNPSIAGEFPLENVAIKLYNECFGFNLSNEEINAMLNWAE